MFGSVNRQYAETQREKEELAIINEAASEVIGVGDDVVMSEDDEMTAVDADSISDAAVAKVLKTIDGMDDEDAFDTLESMIDEEDLGGDDDWAPEE